MLSAGLILIAAGLSRHLRTVTLLEGTLTSARLADHLLIREFLRWQRGELQIPAEEVPGYFPSVEIDAVQLKRLPLPDLELDRVVGFVSWELRGQARRTELSAGVARTGGESGSEP